MATDEEGAQGCREEGTKTHPKPQQPGRRMGGQRTEDSLGTTETAADNCDGADGARSKHGALARCKYNLLALEATEATEEPWRNGRGQKYRRRRTKTSSAHSMRKKKMEERTRRGDPPKCHARLTGAAIKGGKEGRYPPPSGARPQRVAGASGGEP